MAEKDYPAALRVRCGEAAYRGVCGESAFNLWGWDHLGPTAKERYVRAAVMVLDAAKETGRETGQSGQSGNVRITPPPKGGLFGDD